MDSITTLTEFLLARIAEDEAVARAASPAPWHYGDVESVAGGMLYDQTRTIASLIYEQLGDHDGTIIRHLLSDEADANGAHIARHDPARVLAECEAKRQIVALYEYARETGQGPGGYLERALAALALPYADHPDFDPEWKP